MAVIYPVSDLVSVGWTPSIGGSAYATVDEVAYDDADYVTSNGASLAPLVMGLGASLPAGTHTIRVRAGMAEGTTSFRAVMLDSGGATVGATAYQAIDTNWATYSLSVALSGAADRVRIELLPLDALSITDGVLSLDELIVGLS